MSLPPPSMAIILASEARSLAESAHEIALDAGADSASRWHRVNGCASLGTHRDDSEVMMPEPTRPDGVPELHL
jgi:hypothetical protein